jgi:hypothetical protein
MGSFVLQALQQPVEEKKEAVVGSSSVGEGGVADAGAGAGESGKKPAGFLNFGWSRS